MRLIIATFISTIMLTAACDLSGLFRMCPSDPCVVDDDCPDEHVCGVGQCLKPCATLDECPGDARRCYDPQDVLGFSVCADADGVPGQACLIEGETTG